MASAERPCQICGLYAAPEELQSFTYKERVKVFRGSARTRPGDGDGPVFGQEPVTRVDRVCDRCAEALAAGKPPSALRGRRAMVQMAFFCAILLLIVVLTPLLLPVFMSALWLR